MPEALIAKYVGVPFKWNGKSVEEGLDCVGLVLSLLYEAGFRYNDDGPRDADWWKVDPQRAIREVLCRAPKIDRIEDLQPYDVVLFREGTVTKHIGVYLGYSKFLHTYKDTSGIGRLDDKWKQRFVAAVRPSREAGL